MRVRNKEMRNRWRRKEKKIKELIALAKAGKAEGQAKPKAKAEPAKKAPAAKAETADKPKRTTKKKAEAE